METDWKKGGRKGGKGFSGSKQQAFFSHSTPPPSSPLLSSLFSARPFNFALYNPPSSSSLLALFHTPHFSSTLAIPAPRLSRQTLLPPNPPTTPHRPSQKRRQQQTAYSKGGLGGKGARQEKKGVEGGREQEAVVFCRSPSRPSDGGRTPGGAPSSACQRRRRPQQTLRSSQGSDGRTRIRPPPPPPLSGAPLSHTRGKGRGDKKRVEVACVSRPPSLLLSSSSGFPPFPTRVCLSHAFAKLAGRRLPWQYTGWIRHCYTLALPEQQHRLSW